MLPMAWAGSALQAAVNGQLDQLREMRDQWPFFASRLSMLDGVCEVRSSDQLVV